jgi:hypothetical protein
MHYFPAALIGQFGQPRPGKAARDRRVWVARRGHATPYFAPAKSVGFDRSHPHIYGFSGDTGPGIGLDDLWQIAERQLGRTTDALETALQGRAIDAETFVTSVTPFIAQLLARHPMLGIEPGPLSDLRSNEARPAELDARMRAFETYWDALLYSRTWHVVLAPPGERFVTNDLGWTLVPPYLLTVPLGPDRAFVIGRKERTSTYNHCADEVVLERLDWPASEVRLQRQLLMRQAPTSVFAWSKADCDEAIALWTEGAASGSTLEDTAATLGRFPSLYFAFMLRHDAPTDAWTAVSRTRLATHRFGCSCIEAMTAQNVSAERVDLAIAQLHDGRRSAYASLAPWQRDISKLT